MLLNPFEEKLNIPSGLVKAGNSDSWQSKVIHEKNQSFSRDRIYTTDAPQMDGIRFAGSSARKRNSLIASQAGIFVYHGLPRTIVDVT